MKFWIVVVTGRAVGIIYSAAITLAADSEPEAVGQAIASFRAINPGCLIDKIDPRDATGDVRAFAKAHPEA